MSLTLYTHPLASYCHKVLIALHEKAVPFTPEVVDFSDPGSAAVLAGHWPVAKIPVLRDGATNRTIPESSIIIEYLDETCPGPRLLPEETKLRLEALLWDRFFDNYVSTPMQKIVGDRLRGKDGRDPTGVEEARRTLDTSYAMIEAQLTEKTWATGETFTLADCAAAPALFFATIVHPPGPERAALSAYLERLLERPSFRRVLDEARPYFGFFPYRDAMPERFLRP